MRLSQGALVALTCMAGCVRFGYDAQHLPSDQPPDAQSNDAGTAPMVDASTIYAGMDAAVIADAGAGNQMDASVMDASAQDASVPDVMAQDASNHVVDAGAMDASMPNDTGTPEDSATPVTPDSGSMLMDAATSSSGPCTFLTTKNEYVGNGHYHGTLELKNTGTTTWTMPTVAFDLPSGSNYCNDEATLPGAGWTLLTSGVHCTFTKTLPVVSVAAGATLTFEYSSNIKKSISSPSVSNVSVSGCP